MAGHGLLVHTHLKEPSEQPSAVGGYDNCIPSTDEQMEAQRSSDLPKVTVLVFNSEDPIPDLQASRPCTAESKSRATAITLCDFQGLTLKEL